MSETTKELFVVERQDGVWVSAADGVDYSVFQTRSEAQDALDSESDNGRFEDSFQIVRFVRAPAESPKAGEPRCNACLLPNSDPAHDLPHGDFGTHAFVPAVAPEGEAIQYLERKVSICEQNNSRWVQVDVIALRSLLNRYTSPANPVPGAGMTAEQSRELCNLLRDNPVIGKEIQDIQSWRPEGLAKVISFICSNKDLWQAVKW